MSVVHVIHIDTFDVFHVVIIGTLLESVHVLKVVSLHGTASIIWFIWVGSCIKTTWDIHSHNARSVFGRESISSLGAQLFIALEGNVVFSLNEVFNNVGRVGEIWAVHEIIPEEVKGTSGSAWRFNTGLGDGGDGSESYEFHFSFFNFINYKKKPFNIE